VIRPLRLATLLLLGGCSAVPSVRAVSAGPEGVAFEIAAGRQEAATRRAMLYCANLGLSAVLAEVKPSGEGVSVVRYECR
jgi:uncharacterized protein YceK